jgi:hypothetical protein
MTTAFQVDAFQIERYANDVADTMSGGVLMIGVLLEYTAAIQKKERLTSWFSG